MIENPENYLHPNFLKRNFAPRKTAQKVYESFILSHFRKYPQTQPQGEMKNILHINTAVGQGGAAKVAYDFLNKNLSKKDLNSKILTKTNYDKAIEDVEILECKNKKLHKLLHNYSKRSGLLDFFNLSSFKIPNLECFQNTDVIHLHNLHGAYFSPFILPKLTSLKPTIWTLHDEQSFTGHCSYSFECNKWQTGCGNCPDLNYYPKLKTDSTDFLWQTKQKIYDLSYFTVVCPSKWLADRAKQSILKNKDIRVIHNGIDTNIFKPTDKQKAREILNLPTDKLILMFSASNATANPQKGGKFVYEAYNVLKNNKDILFLNIGGKSKSKKQNWINIPYIKKEEEMALYYSAADLFIYPSLVEAFGLVSAESLACQTPVIAFDYSATPEIVDHNKTGYLAKYKDSEDFINGIKIFLESKALRKQAGIEGRKKVLDNFTIDKMVNSYIDLYNETFENRLYHNPQRDSEIISFPG